MVDPVSGLEVSQLTESRPEARLRNDPHGLAASLRGAGQGSMATDAVAIPFTASPGRYVPGTLRGASETLSTTPSDREGMAVQSQSRVNDAELIREAQRGNQAAFEELVRQYDGPVLRLAYHMTRSEQDAQDIYQEAFLKAYRNIGSFRFECSFYTWIYRIAINTAKNWSHALPRRSTVSR
mgnify:CR=1 FL=1